MSQFFTKHSFWVVQILSWIAASVFITSASVEPDESLWEALTTGISLSVTGIITTSILRYYLKRNVPLNDFNGKSLLKVSISSVIATILMVPIGLATIIITVGLERLLGFEKNTPNSGPNFETFDFGLILTLSIAFFFIITGWVIFYYSIKFIRKSYRDNLAKLELRNSVKEAQINMLRGQLDPGFMAESLNKVDTLMTHNVNEARNMITKLAEVLRFTLTKKNEAAATVEEELEIIRNYIDIYKLDIKSDFKFSETIEEQLMGISMPAMLMLSMVENILKNGIDSTKASNFLELSVIKERKDLMIRMQHNAPITKKYEYESSIRKLRQRLRLQFEDNAQLDISNTKLKSSIIITLPNFQNQDQ